MTEKKRNVLFTLQFDGTRYAGYQVQPDRLTIMECFQDALERVMGTRWDIKGCSRTDAGVHASKYCISMRFRAQIPAVRFIRSLNQFLPEDIAVIDAIEVPLDFHARYDCVSKEYTYLVHNSFIKDVFRPTQTHQFRYPEPIHVEMLHEQAQDFVGTHDFTAFCGDNKRKKSSVRTVYQFSVERKGEQVIFKVSGDGFVYHMVRIMVGTLLDISFGRLPQGSIPKILAAKDRLQAGVTAPACGLYLSDVVYPEEVFFPHEPKT